MPVAAPISAVVVNVWPRARNAVRFGGGEEPWFGRRRRGVALAGAGSGDRFGQRGAEIEAVDEDLEDRGDDHRSAG